MPAVELPGAVIYYERAGDGPPLLHVVGSGSDLGRTPSPLAWPGAERFDQVAYDHRGLGRSRAADPRAQPTMADFGADALVLADHLGWERFAVVGVSFGGMVAQELAISAPERVTRLVLACTSSGGRGGSSAPLHELDAAAVVELLDTRSAADPRLLALLTNLAAGRGEPEPDGYARQLEARRHHDTWERLGAIAAPTLVAAGRYDGIAPLRNAQALASQIAGAHLEVFEGGHPFLAQDPRAWPLIGEFLLSE